MATLQLPIPKDRTLHFSEQVNQSTINNLLKSIVEISDDDEYLKKVYALHNLSYTPNPIRIFIDSFGGQVYQCLGLIGVMETCPTPIYTYTTGCAMSCGFIIAISGHRRFAYSHATFMYHQVSSFNAGKLADMQEDLAENKRLQKKIEEITLRRTRIPKSDLKDNFKKRIDWYITADQALKLGVIDELIS